MGGLPVVLASPAQRIDHSARRLRVDMEEGTVTADAVIVTVPSRLLADDTLSFSPPLPEKIAAAVGLPLGLNDKLYLSLSEASEFEMESRLFGRTDRSRTGVYHFRPFGRALIEAYFGGSQAAELEAAGEAAFADFAITELVGLLGSNFARGETTCAASLGQRSLRPRVLFPCFTRPGGLPRHAGRAGRRSLVLCRRSLFAAGLFHRAWRLSHRRRRRGAGDSRAGKQRATE
jgi:hypothetical protein